MTQRKRALYIMTPSSTFHFSPSRHLLQSLAALRMGLGLSPPKYRMTSRPWNRWSRIRVPIKLILQFRIVIVSAVKISKQYLQTASASGRLRPNPLVGLCPTTPLGNFRPPGSLGCNPKLKLPGVATDNLDLDRRTQTRVLSLTAFRRDKVREMS